MTAPLSIVRTNLEPQNETIDFAIGSCSLGSILVAASPKGICALTLADDPALLKADLRKRFPKSELSEIDLSKDPRLQNAIDFVESPHAERAIELDLRGTDFQQRVWEALREIPFGKTATYTEIAAKTGRPKAVRAVAQACASNPVAILVPCHRVLRRDGSLSGYRWGIDRKRKLLQMEQMVLA